MLLPRVLRKGGGVPAMHRVTIRVEGTDEGLAWLQTVLDLTPHAQWSKGEPLLRGV
jgi:hypothetical protein